MPRDAREKSSSGIYHIMLRGINRQTIFEDDEDKAKFIETLKKYKDISGYHLYGYCLMDNHVHLLLREGDEPVSVAIKRISSSYVYWYNFKYERCGHLFQERYGSENVDTTSYFITVLRYIHQNPLKAGLESNVFNCKWTSIKEYVAKADFVEIGFALQLFSSDKATARAWFIKYMQESNDDTCLEYTVKVRVSDDVVREYLHKLGITNSSMLQHMDKEARDAVLGKLKQINGATVRQLARVTGISKSVIDRVR